MKRKQHILLLLAVAALLLVNGCAGETRPAVTVTPLAPVTSTPLATAQTLTPQPVEVTLATAPGSPSTAFFEVYDQAGARVYQTANTLGRSDTLYLPPGEYHWVARAPIPTQPPGCSKIIENYGFHHEGQLTVSHDPVRVEVKIGFIVEMCTPTPAGS